jgi:ribonuclease P protein component
LTRTAIAEVADGPTGPLGVKEATGEANLPAEQSKTSETAWVPSPHVDPCRPGHHQSTSPEGPTAIVGLTTTAAIGPWRIRDRRTFSALRRAPRARCGPLTVSFIDGNPAVPPRVAYAVGRRVGGAVERNRLRRRLRAIVGQLAPDLRPGAYLIAAAPEAAGLTVGELQSTVIRALEAGGTLRRSIAGRPRPEVVE